MRQTNMGLKLSSSQFADGANIPARFTCKDINVNPPLEIKGVPDSAKSLVLILHDPDAPIGDFVHWTIWNIEPATSQIPEGALPIGAVEGMTSFDQTGYGGAGPPARTQTNIILIYVFV